MLPTLLRFRALPKRPPSISPFELMYGWPVLNSCLSPNPLPLPDHLLTPLLHHLCSLLWDFPDYSLPQPCTHPCPSPINIGDQVLFSLPTNVPHPFLLNGRAPFKAILVIPTAAMLEGLPHWIHLSHLRPFPLLIYGNSNRALFP